MNRWLSLGAASLGLVLLGATLAAGSISCSSSASAPLVSPEAGDDASLSPDAPSADAPSADAADGGTTNPLIAARPYNFKVPSGYDATKPTPLVILLHGYGATGVVQDNYFKLGALADVKTFLYAFPDGTLDAQNRRFWNATDACCNFGKVAVDDVAYIGAIIDDVASKYNVDPKRVFVVGHSNGGFMAHRLACDLAPRIAAIVSLAGAVYADPARCVPASPVAVLQVHGDADATVSYDGGAFGGVPFPSAHATVATWATKDGCTGTLQPTGVMLDLDTQLAGKETRVESYGACPAGAVELWTIQGGGHIPSLQPTWAGTIYDFLSAHPKP